MDKKDLYKYFPQSWYPICLSSEIKKNEIKEIEAFSTKLIIFRNQKNEIGVIKKYCPHMGTNLKNSKMGSDGPICPFHLREFDKNGKCLRMYGHDKIPNNAHTKSLEVIEKFKIIFVFWGDKIGFEFPKFSRLDDQEKYVCSKPANYKLNTPYHSLLFNGFDTHHLGCIHSRVVSEDPIFKTPERNLMTADYAMEALPNRFYDLIVSKLNTSKNIVNLKCWGGNFLIIQLENTKDNILITSMPINNKESKIFLTSITNPIGNSLFRLIRLKFTTFLGVEFLRPDIDIIEGMRPEIKSLYGELDKGVIEFWKYWENLPRDKEFQNSFNS